LTVTGNYAAFDTVLCPATSQGTVHTHGRWSGHQ